MDRRRFRTAVEKLRAPEYKIELIINYYQENNYDEDFDFIYVLVTPNIKHVSNSY